MKQKEKKKSAGKAKTSSKNSGRRPDAAQRSQERDVRRQNEFLANVLEFLPYPFYVIDARDHSVVLANSAAGSVTSSDGLTCYALTHRRDTPCTAGGHLCPLDEVKRTRKSVVMEHVHYDSEGNPQHVEVHGHPILDAEGNVAHMIEYCLDVTERKRAEQERLQREKLQGVLETAGAACHELNQPIQALFAYLHSAFKLASKDDPLYGSLKEVKREINRIAGITHKLNNITRYESQPYFRDVKIINLDKSSK